MVQSMVEYEIPTPCPECGAGMYSICYKNSPVKKLYNRFRSLIICKDCAYETSGEQQEERMITV